MKRKTMQKRFFVPCASAVCFACLTAFLVSGCGGSSGSSNSAPLGSPAASAATGRAVFRITWPAKTATRLIPQASLSVQIQVWDGDKLLDTRIVPRPSDGMSSVVEIDDLPAKKLRDVVRAYPTGAASGVAQAEVEAEVEIKSDKTIDVPLTMESTIARLDLSPTTEVNLAPGATQTYVATPRDANGAQVLVAPSGLQWKTDAPQNVSIDQNGLATAIKDSRVTVTVTEPESGKSASVPLSVFSDPCADRGPGNGPTPYIEFRDVPTSATVGGMVTFQFVIHHDAFAYPDNLSNVYAYVTVPGDTVKVARISPDPYDPRTNTARVYLGTAGAGDTVYSISYRQTDTGSTNCNLSGPSASVDLRPAKSGYATAFQMRITTP